MIRTALAALAFLALFAATAHAEETRVIDGTCGHSSTVIGDLADAVQKANHDCLPENSLERPGAEQAELASLEDGYHRWIQDECGRFLCMNNLWGAIVSSRDYVWQTRNVLAGCGEWASRSAGVLAGKGPRYWSVREVEYGRDPKWGAYDRYHWAVELQNTRTGEIVVVDGYRAAARARSAAFWSPASTDAVAIAKSDETGPQSDETSRWGAPSHKGGCENGDALCDPKPCKS